jgi:hypothetical protein
MPTYAHVLVNTVTLYGYKFTVLIFVNFVYLMNIYSTKHMSYAKLNSMIHTF